MVATECLLLLLILALSFGLRCLFLPFTSSDDHVHLYFARLTAERGLLGSLRHQPSQSLVAGVQPNPPLHFWFLSFFPQKSWPVAARFLNFGYDIAAAGVVYVTARFWFLGGHAETTLLGLSPALLVTLLFVTTPALFPVSARLLSVGSRTLGTLTTLAYLLALSYAMLYGSAIAYVLGGVLVIVSCLSSRFGFQATVFISVGLSCFALSPAPVLVVAMSLAIASAIPWLGVRELLLNRYHHMRWYVRALDGTGIAKRNSLREFLQIPRLLRKDWTRLAKLLLKHNSFTVAALSIPALILTGCWFVRDPAAWSAVRADVSSSLLLSIVLASLAVFVATSIRPLVVFGEAERYASYATPFLYLLLVKMAVVAGSGGVAFAVLAGAHLLMIGVHWWFIRRFSGSWQKLEPQRESLDGLARFICSQKQLKVLCVPLKFAFRLAYLCAGSDAAFYLDFVMQRNGYDYMFRFSERYDRPVLQVDEFRREFEVNSIVAIKDDKRTRAIEAFKELPILFENEDYVVYDCVPATSNGEQEPSDESGRHEYRKTA